MLNRVYKVVFMTFFLQKRVCKTRLLPDFQTFLWSLTGWKRGAWLEMRARQVKAHFMCVMPKGLLCDWHIYGHCHHRDFLGEKNLSAPLLTGWITSFPWLLRKKIRKKIWNMYIVFLFNIKVNTLNLSQRLYFERYAVSIFTSTVRL